MPSAHCGRHHCHLCPFKRNFVGQIDPWKMGQSWQFWNKRGDPHWSADHHRFLPLQTCLELGIPLANSKLAKCLYFSQLAFLKRHDKSLRRLSFLWQDDAERFLKCNCFESIQFFEDESLRYFDGKLCIETNYPFEFQGILSPAPDMLWTGWSIDQFGRRITSPAFL